MGFRGQSGIVSNIIETSDPLFTSSPYVVREEEKGGIPRKGKLVMIHDKKLIQQIAAATSDQKVIVLQLCTDVLSKQCMVSGIRPDPKGIKEWLRTQSGQVACLEFIRATMVLASTKETFPDDSFERSSCPENN